MPTYKAEAQVILRGVNKTGTSLKDAAQGLKSLDKNVKSLQGAFSALGVVMAGRAVYQMAAMGAGAMRLEASFEELARQAGTSGDAILEAVKRASGGTVSENELILASNKAMMLGVADSAAEMGDLMEVARFRARAMGLTTTQAYSDIVTGIGRMSPMILDNLGIVIDSKKAFDEYAASLGTTADALTNAEKKQALLNSVLATGKEQIAAAGGVIEDQADTYEAFGASLENIKTYLGEILAMNLTPLVKGTGEGAGGVEGFLSDSARIQKLTDQYRKLFQAQRGAVGDVTFDRANMEMGSLIMQMRSGKRDVDAFAASLEKIARFYGFILPGQTMLPMLTKGSLVQAGEEERALRDERIKAAWDIATAEEDAANRREQVAFSLREKLIRVATEVSEENKKLAKDVADAWQDQADSAGSLIGGIMAPATGIFDYDQWLEQHGQYRDKPWEVGKRLLAVAGGDIYGESAQLLADEGILPLGSDPALAAKLLDEFQRGLHPEWIKQAPLARMIREEIQRKESWDGIFAGLGGALTGQLQTEREGLQASGKAAGEVIAGGVIAALGEPNFLGVVAHKVAPDVARIIDDRGRRSGAVP
jgi:hypothetical protein